MGIVIDLANPETDVEDVRTVVNRMVKDEVLNFMYRLFEYALGESGSISDEDIKTVISYGEQSGLASGTDTVDELRVEIESQREQLLSNGGATSEMPSHLLNITEYVLLGENQKVALNSQREGISNDWDMTLSIPVI